MSHGVCVLCKAAAHAAESNVGIPRCRTSLDSWQVMDSCSRFYQMAMVSKIVCACNHRWSCWTGLETISKYFETESQPMLTGLFQDNAGLAVSLAVALLQNLYIEQHLYMKEIQVVLNLPTVMFLDPTLVVACWGLLQCWPEMPLRLKLDTRQLTVQFNVAEVVSR